MPRRHTLHNLIFFPEFPAEDEMNHVIPTVDRRYVTWLAGRTGVYFATGGNIKVVSMDGRVREMFSFPVNVFCIHMHETAENSGGILRNTTIRLVPCEKQPL